MAPIWIRKHRELVPSVFVLVLRLYEFDLSGGTYKSINEEGNEAALSASVSKDKDQTDVGPLEKEKIERINDNELVNDILNRKRICAERGVKLAVVLLTSREILGSQFSFLLKRLVSDCHRVSR